MGYMLFTSPTVPLIVLASLLLIEFLMAYRAHMRPALAKIGAGKSRVVEKIERIGRGRSIFDVYK